MQRRRLIATGMWLAGTVLATAMVWTATSIVAAEVTDRPPPLVDHRDVEMALESGTPGEETAPGISLPEDSASPPAAGTPGSPKASGGIGAGPGPAAPSPSPTVASPPPAPPTPTPNSPPPTQPPPGGTTYSTAGGTITVACDGFLIRLVSATPKNGFSTNVVNGGPYFVEVHFVRPGQDVPIWSFCMGAPVRIDVPGVGGWWPISAS